MKRRLDMNKILSILGVIVFLGTLSPVFASHGGHGHHGGNHHIHAGSHHRHHSYARGHHHHGSGIRIYTSHYPRHGYWYGYGHSYRFDPYCDHRLGYYNCIPPAGMCFSIGRPAISIRF
jgi:hypothetical protein